MKTLRCRIMDGQVVLPDEHPALQDGREVLLVLPEPPDQSTPTLDKDAVGEQAPAARLSAGILPDGTTPRHVLEAPTSLSTNGSLFDVLCTGDDPFSLTLAVDFVTFVANGLASKGRDISGTTLAITAVAAELMKVQAEELDHSDLPRQEVLQRWNAKLSEVSGLLSQLVTAKPAPQQPRPARRPYTTSPIQDCTVGWQREIAGVMTCWEVRLPNRKLYVAKTYPDSDVIDIETADGKRVVGKRLQATMRLLHASGKFQRPAP